MAEMFVRAGAHWVVLDFDNVDEAERRPAADGRSGAARASPGSTRTPRASAAIRTASTSAAHSSGAHLGGCVVTTDWQDYGVPGDIVKGALLCSRHVRPQAGAAVEALEIRRVHRRDRAGAELAAPSRPAQLPAGPGLRHLRDAGIPAPDPRVRRRGEGGRQAASTLLVGEGYNHFEMRRRWQTPTACSAARCWSRWELGGVEISVVKGAALTGPSQPCVCGVKTTRRKALAGAAAAAGLAIAGGGKVLALARRARISRSRRRAAAGQGADGLARHGPAGARRRLRPKRLRAEPRSDPQALRTQQRARARAHRRAQALAYGPAPIEAMDVSPRKADKCARSTCSCMAAPGAPGWPRTTPMRPRAFVNAGAHHVVPDFNNVLETGGDLIAMAAAGASAPSSGSWKNAESFGGDPNGFTCAGHSSGGHLAGVLLTTDWLAATSDCRRA